MIVNLKRITLKHIVLSKLLPYRIGMFSQIARDKVDDYLAL